MSESFARRYALRTVPFDLFLRGFDRCGIFYFFFGINLLLEIVMRKHELSKFLK